MKKAANIITLIKQDHRPLKSGIRVLKNDAASATRKMKTLKRFLNDLKLHAKSEERSLYQNTIEQDAVRSFVLEGFEEHALVDLLTAQLERINFERHWSDEVAAKAKVLAELVELHLQEEEQFMLPAMTKIYDVSDLRKMGHIYTTTRHELEIAVRREEEIHARTQRVGITSSTRFQSKRAVAVL